MREGILFILSGPAGSGKTTLTKKLIEKFSDIRFSVSCTTRKKRPGELDGVDYRFLSEGEFKEMIQKGGFAEWATVHGNLYGTPIKELENSILTGVDLILDLDVQGARNIRGKYSSGVYIFLVPSSFDVLRERLIKRQSDEQFEIKKRLEDAKKEMEEVQIYDYIIINDSLDEALEKLAAIVVAERCRRDRVLVLIESSF